MATTAIVIDDDSDVVLAISELLTTLGIKVVGKASTAQSAIESFVNTAPDLIFTDIALEHSDGFFVIKTIRNISSKAKIIVVTGDVSLQTKQNLEKLGVSNIVYKPFSSGDIKDAIKKELKF